MSRVEEILDTPDEEIGLWVAKTDLVNYALRANTSVQRGGEMADDGLILSDLTRVADTDIEWVDHPLFEEAVLYEMKRGIDYHTVVAYAAAKPLHPSAQNLVARTALREGLQRISFFPEVQDANAEVIVPLGVLAALAFQRANIKEELDRRLYERERRIQATSSMIKELIKPRRVSLPGSFSGHSEIAQEEHLVYRLLSYPKDLPPEILDNHIGGIDKNISLSPWWQELIRDLVRMDNASADSRGLS